MNKIEKYILERKASDYKPDFKPFTIDEFISRIEKYEQDFKNGKFKTQSDLENLSESW